MEPIKKDDYIYIKHESITVNTTALEEAILFAKKYNIDVLTTENNHKQDGVIVQENYWNNFCQIYYGVNLRVNWLLISKIGENRGRHTKTDIPVLNCDVSEDQSYNRWKTWWIMSRIITNNMHEISDIHLTDFIRTCHIGSDDQFILEMLQGIGIEHSDTSIDKIFMDKEIKWIKNPIYKISLNQSLLTPIDESILKTTKDQILTTIVEQIH